MDIKSAIFAVLNQNGDIVGTGFLVAPHLTVTCAHVIFDIGATAGSNVQIQFSGQKEIINALVMPEYWRDVDQGDIAFLKLDSVPKGITPLRLGLATDSRPGNPFYSFGYANAADVQGIIARGTIDGYLPEHKLLQLQAPQADHGISGAPVLDEKRGAIIGMFTKGHTELGRNELTTFATPSETIWKVYPDITSNIDFLCARRLQLDRTLELFDFSEQSIEKLIDLVLKFFDGNAVFTTLPNGELHFTRGDEKLVFSSSAFQNLVAIRNVQAYLLSLIIHQDFRIWATHFVPLSARMDVRQEIPDFILPISFSEFIVPPENSDEDARIIFQPIKNINEALNKHPGFIILGEPGSGKTTTLQKIALNIAIEFLKYKKGRIPLFIRLSQQGYQSPYDFLKEKWEQRTGLDFFDALKEGSILILADGINELPRHEIRYSLKQWMLFFKEYNHTTQIVFTGRERDYENQLDLPRVRIDPLDSSHIAEFLNKHGVPSLINVLKEKQLHYLANNPFNLSLLIFAYRLNQRNMKNIGQLLSWFVSELFHREEIYAHYNWVSPKDQNNIFSKLAFAMQTNGCTTFLSLSEASTIIASVLSNNVGKHNFQDLIELGCASTIFDSDIETGLRFYHQILQEYFAAFEFIRRFEIGENLSFTWRAPREMEEFSEIIVGKWDQLPPPPSTGWENVIIIACGLTKQPEKIIEMIGIDNPILAGRCLDESGISKIQLTTTEIIQQKLFEDVQNIKIHFRSRLQSGYILGKIGNPRLKTEKFHGIQVIFPQMVSVPTGIYPVGSDTPIDYFNRAVKFQKVALSGFEIGKWPVTNAEFKCFIDAGGYNNPDYWKDELSRQWLEGKASNAKFSLWMDSLKWLKTHQNWQEMMLAQGVTPKQITYYEHMATLDEQKYLDELIQRINSKSRKLPQYWDNMERNNPSQPVTALTWFEARAYCLWLSEILGKPYRLPKETEWEAAVRGEQGFLYPWGNNWDPTKANTIESRIFKTTPIGMYLATKGTSVFGIEDQCGNVFEWTNSLFSFELQENQNDSPNLDGERVVKGGSWGSAYVSAVAFSRGGDEPGWYGSDIGFRLAS